jgi:glycosyltransferase involved in cell wall biosynthesis
MEVVVVDDGSDTDEAHAFLDRLEQDIKERQWRVVRQENLYAGAARNTAARNASGEYFFFMDDDNIARPDEIRTFVEVAESTDAELLTCFGDVFEGKEPPDESAPALRRTLFLGDAAAAGLYFNMFGDANFLIKREVFKQLDGFTEDYGVGLEDHEFFARAVLEGRRLYVIPEALYWYRETETRIRHRHYDPRAGYFRVMRPYLETAPVHLRNLIMLSQGQFLRTRMQHTPPVQAETRSGEELAQSLRDLMHDQIGRGNVDAIKKTLSQSPRLYELSRWLVRLQYKSFLRLLDLQSASVRKVSRTLSDIVETVGKIKDK